MKNGRSHAELVTLRKHAEENAAARKERMTSVHLLAAIAAGGGPASEVLRDRRLDEETLLKASRSFDDEGPDPVGRLMASARQIAGRAFDGAMRNGAAENSSVPPRAAATEPAAVHLLLAALADRGAAAHRALLHAGVDLARLRTAAMQVALGMVTARRPGPGAQGASPSRSPERGPSGAGEARSIGPTSTRRARPLTTLPERPLAAAHRESTRAPLSGSSSPGVTVSLFPPPPTARREAPRPSSPPPATVSPTPTGPTTAPRGEAEPQRSIQPGAAPLSRRSTPPPPASAPSDSGLSAAQMARFTLDRAQFPVLSALGHNLTLAAAERRLDDVVGRDAEIERLLDVLAKRHANSACLVGPPGVGKTAVARGLAHRYAQASEADARVLVEVVVSELLAGTGTRGALAEKIAAIRAELREAGGRVILFVDELHELFGASALDEATAEVKLAMSRGELRLIGATTPEDYRRAIESDGALARRITVVEVEEPGEADAFLLLQGVGASLGRHHGLAYSDEAIACAVSWSIRYLPGRALPDKAIAILDLAGARARRKLGAASRPGLASTAASVGPPEVAHVVAELADLPVERLLETDRERMLGLEAILAERVVGHAPSLARIARVLRRNAAGLRGKRPIGTFLLLGPTGVGKTETAKAIAETLFHSPDAMTRLDFSEYAEAHAVARLIGAPPGYVGHEAGGQLTEAVRRRPYQVVLLDEIEKAHRDVLEAFLQVFDEGRLTDGRGRRVDFTNTVIVLTSNLGAAEAGAMKAERSVGFARSGSAGAAGISAERLAETMLGAARSHLPPELYNRLDEVLCFGALTRAEVSEIARRLLTGLEDALSARGVRLDVDPAVIDVLMTSGGFDPELGARPMKRTIARLIENPLADLILKGELEEGSVALVEVERGEIVVDALADDEQAEAAAS